MDKRISRFLRKHHVLTLSTVSEQGSWSAHVFYAWMPEHDALVFTTESTTRHGRDMLANPSVSGGIVLETKVVGRIRGVQLKGKTKRLGDQETERPRDQETERPRDQETMRPETGDQRLITYHASRVTYLKRFPYAIAAKLDLWVLEIEYVKMTDNRLGFGTKLEWRRGD